MKFEEAIQILSSKKIAPNAIFDLSRDARTKSIEALLIEKGISTKEEIDAENEKQLGELVKMISSMPPIPNDNTQNNNNTKKTDSN